MSQQAGGLWSLRADCRIAFRGIPRRFTHHLFALKEEAMFGLGTPELIILAVIILVLFGSRLPSAMRSLGGSFHSFKKGMQDGEDEDKHLDSKES